jgi:polyphenol oxidase
MTGNGFSKREAHGVPFFICRSLDALGFCRHGFSTRHGSIETQTDAPFNLGPVGWDTRERVDANRERFLHASGLDNARLITLRQVHSDRVVVFEETSDSGSRPEGDALVTGVKRVALGIQTADCLPILIADPVARAVANVHSGWRGTLSRVLSRTIAAMRASFGSEAADLIVAIGPGIRSCCYEVGEEVVELFQKEYPAASLFRASSDGKQVLDIPKALRAQLQEAGVCPDNVHDIGMCTRCHPEEFFSYRLEGPRAGRMLAVIGNPE